MKMSSEETSPVACGWDCGWDCEGAVCREPPVPPFDTTSIRKGRELISPPLTFAVAAGSWKVPVFFGSRM